MIGSFEHQKARYRPANACWMATIAKLTYLKEPKSGAPNAGKILAELRKLDGDVEDVIPFDKNNSQAILVRHKEYVVAAFRGSDELADWWDNLNAVATDGPLGRVHGGFQKALMDVWPAMRSQVRIFRQKHDKPLPLWLTGHSLGGAMATLAAAQLIDGDETFHGAYTFGQPRCGDRDFARVFNIEAKERFFRFQNNNDYATRLPTRIMGYSHVGSFVYISEDGKLSTDVGFWYRFLDGVKGVVDDIGEIGIDAVTDHDIDGYLSAIKNWGNRAPEN